MRNIVIKFRSKNRNEGKNGNTIPTRRASSLHWGRDEKGCLLSTEKKAAVDVDHRPDSSFLGRRQPDSSFLLVDVHFTTLFITPENGTF